MLKITKKIVRYEVKTEEKSRPKALKGVTYKVKGGEMQHAVYVTITNNEEEGKELPFEIFLNTKDAASTQWIVALMRLISALLRTRQDIRLIVDELREVYDPTGGLWYEGHYRPSLVSVIGDVLEQHCIEMGLWTTTKGKSKGTEQICAKCGERAVVKKDGCETCTACGEGKCT